MSTILKALRRLEEDSSLDASTSLDPASPASSLPETNPNATDELRNRILAEESAAQASGADRIDASTSKRRVRIIASIAGATLLTALIVGGLVLGFNSSTPGPDDTSESNALASASRPAPSPRSPSPSGRSLPPPNPPLSPPSANPLPSPQSPPSPSPPTPLADSAEQAPSANGRSDNQPSAGPGLGIAAIPIVQSDNELAGGDSSTPSARPGPPRTASSPTPAPPPARRPPQFATSAPSEEIPPVAVARTPAAPEIESATGDSFSAGLERGVPPTVASATRPKAESALASSRGAAESQSTRPGPIRSAHPAPAVSAAKPSPISPISPIPPIEKPLKATAEAPPKPSAESTPQPTPAEVEKHKGRTIPDITVLRTAWHPSPERRSAKIRLLETKETLNLKEGDAVGALVIQEITPSAVIFRSGEIELRLRVGQPGSGG